MRRSPSPSSSSRAWWRSVTRAWPASSSSPTDESGRNSVRAASLRSPISPIRPATGSSNRTELAEPIAPHVHPKGRESQPRDRRLRSVSFLIHTVAFLQQFRTRSSPSRTTASPLRSPTSRRWTGTWPTDRSWSTAACWRPCNSPAASCRVGWCQSGPFRALARNCSGWRCLPLNLALEPRRYCFWFMKVISVSVTFAPVAGSFQGFSMVTNTSISFFPLKNAAPSGRVPINVKLPCCL
jgi:hypothetical protein